MTAHPDALELLESDHQAIVQLLDRYDLLAGHGAPPARRQALAEEICLALTIHARLEDEVFDPAVRGLPGVEDVLDDADAAHASIRDLVLQLMATRVRDALHDVRMAVLADYVRAHQQAEVVRLFPRVRASALDLQRLGQRLRERQTELRAVPEALREDLLVAARLEPVLQPSPVHDDRLGRVAA